MRAAGAPQLTALGDHRTESSSCIGSDVMRSARSSVSANIGIEEGLRLRAQIRRRRAGHRGRDRCLDGRLADGRAYECRSAGGRPSRPARRGISAARARRCGARARSPATSSAWSRCASIATRTRSGSRSSRQGLAPAIPGAALLLPRGAARETGAVTLEFRDAEKPFDPGVSLYQRSRPSSSASG